MSLLNFLNFRLESFQSTFKIWFLSSDLEKTCAFVSGSRMTLGLLFAGFKAKKVIVFASTHGSEFLEFLKSNTVGFLVVTEFVQDMRGDELIQKVKQMQPGVACILLVEEHILIGKSNQVYQSDVVVASPDMLKGDHALRRGILDAIGKRKYRSPSVKHNDENDQDQAILLSETEQKILEFYAEGLTIEEMANRLPQSKSTIKTYSRNLLQKLGVGNRQKALLKAVELGLSDFLKPEK